MKQSLLNSDLHTYTSLDSKLYNAYLDPDEFLGFPANDLHGERRIGKKKNTTSDAFGRSQKGKMKSKKHIRQNEEEKNFASFIKCPQESDSDIQSSDESRSKKRKGNGGGKWE